MSSAAAAVASLRARLVAESRFADGIATTERIEGWLRAWLAARGEADADIGRAARAVLGDSALYAALESGLSPPETWLFRYPESFAHLRAHAAARAPMPQRVLVLGAGGWSEPYSVAAALHAAGCGTPSIEAVDRDARLFHDSEVLDARHARAAIPDWADAAFERRGDALAMRPTLRRCITAEAGDIVALAERRVREHRAYEVVFFRNVAIYMHDEARRAVYAAVRELLVPGGLLFVGHAEIAAASTEPGFRIEECTGAFALRRMDRVPFPAPVPPAVRPVPPGPPPRSNTPPANPRPTPATVAGPARRRDPADPATFISDARKLLGPAPPDARALVAAAGIVDKALYLDPRHEEALLLAAEIAELRGERAAADRFRRRAMDAHLGRAGDADKP